MKKLMYLLFAGSIFIFAACGGGETATQEVTVETVVASCADDCQKACCLGCKATEGDAKCIVLEDGSMPCCIVKVKQTCCCGDSGCDGSCHGDKQESEEVHSHEDHSHNH